MVFGNRGAGSGTGVCFTRNPNTGEASLYGEYLENAQGEDVVAGIRTPLSISTLKDTLPNAYAQLIKVRRAKHLPCCCRRDFPDVTPDVNPITPTATTAACSHCRCRTSRLSSTTTTTCRTSSSPWRKVRRARAYRIVG